MLSSPLSLPGLLGPRPREQKSGLMKTDPPSVKEELVCELLQEFDPHRFVGPDNIHPEGVRELAEIVVRQGRSQPGL